MAMHERAGQVATSTDLTHINTLLADYFDVTPDLSDPTQLVSFGTSGHRGSSSKGSFNEQHISCIVQAVCEYRASQGITGPLLLGYDTHALSEPAFRTAITVLVANGVSVLVDERDGFTPTPAMSHAILRLNGHGANSGDKVDGGVDGLILTPSHNPPSDGGIKYNPPHGGPAGSDATKAIADRANELLHAKLEGVNRCTENEAFAKVEGYDFLHHYIEDLPRVINMEAIASAGVRIGADPMGGASVAYWPAIAERFGLSLETVNDTVDPAWSFMTLDHDGKIRMDCSSPYAMASLVGNKDSYDIATGNDADADRHGIVTPDAGLMNPNHFLAVSIDYLLATRSQWSETAGVGKTLVSSMIIDRVVASHDRALNEVPVGFKWFVDGLVSGDIVFGGEESAGASLLTRDGSVWSTDKDGIVMCLLAAEMKAVTGKSPSVRYKELTEAFGTSFYSRIDSPATPEEKAVLAKLSPSDVTSSELAGEEIIAVMTSAPGNNAAIGGLKVATKNAWFAARPSGTENIYKVYAESLVSEEHLAQVHKEAKSLVDDVLGAASA